jgi:hypothetical protein
LRTKVRTSADGQAFGGKPYARAGLYKLLNNQVYTGRIAHRGETHEGQQQAIIAPETWEKVQALLATNNQGHRQPGRSVTASALPGLVFDAEGNRFTPTHAVKNGRRYRYYTSQAVIQKSGLSCTDCSGSTCQTASRNSEEFKMSLELILIIVVVVFLLGGGGWFWQRGRG